MENQKTFTQKIYHIIRTALMKWFGIEDFNVEVKVLNKPLQYQDIIDMVNLIFDTNPTITKVSIFDEDSRLIKEKLFGSKLTLSTNKGLWAIYLLALHNDQIERVCVVVATEIEKAFHELLVQKEHIIAITR